MILTIFKSNFLHRVSFWQFNVSLQFQGQTFLTVNVCRDFGISLQCRHEELKVQSGILHCLNSLKKRHNDYERS